MYVYTLFSTLCLGDVIVYWKPGKPLGNSSTRNTRLSCEWIIALVQVSEDRESLPRQTFILYRVLHSFGFHLFRSLLFIEWYPYKWNYFYLDECNSVYIYVSFTREADVGLISISVCLYVFMSIDNAFERIFVRFSCKNKRTKFDETLQKAGRYMWE